MVHPSIAASCTRKPFGGCNLDQIATIAMVMHACAIIGGGVPDACLRCCLREACIPYELHNERAACRLTSRRE
jgi:hypothetical protein